MRVVIVSREVAVKPGLYLGISDFRKNDAKRAIEVAKKVKEDDAKSLRSKLKPLPKGFFLPTVEGLVLLALLAGEERRLATAYLLGLNDGRITEAEKLVDWQQELLGKARVVELSGDWMCEPFEKHCITVLGTMAGPFSIALDPFDPILAGQFSTSEQVTSILNDGGGTSRIHVFNLHEARAVLQRHGGGTIEEGIFLLHPKRENVIVPFSTFHAEMLAEMTREARVVMGRIGAKSLVIDTVEGVTLGGEIVSRIPTKNGVAKTEYETKSNRRVTYEWGSPTFDPDIALKDCVWIQDNSGIMTIVDQRRTSNLTRYEEYSKIDTSFKLSIEIMKLFNAGFQWAQTSTYRYEVQLFDKTTI